MSHNRLNTCGYDLRTLNPTRPFVFPGLCQVTLALVNSGVQRRPLTEKSVPHVAIVDLATAGGSLHSPKRPSGPFDFTLMI